MGVAQPRSEAPQSVWLHLDKEALNSDQELTSIRQIAFLEQRGSDPDLVMMTFRVRLGKVWPNSAKTEVWLWEVKGLRCGMHFSGNNRWENRNTYRSEGWWHVHRYMFHDYHLQYNWRTQWDTSQQTHDVVWTSMRRNDVASTSCAGWVGMKRQRKKPRITIDVKDIYDERRDSKRR